MTADATRGGRRARRYILVGGAFATPGSGGTGGSSPLEEIHFKEYADRYWLPTHAVEETTREGYACALRAHLLPFFADWRVADFAAAPVRAWLTALKDTGLSASNRRMCKMVLSAILSSAVDDEIIAANPCRRVRTDPVPAKSLRVVTPAEFEAFLDALPEGMPRLLVECAIETGMCWGELTELRAKDFDRHSGVLTITRAVVHLTAQNQPDGQPFHVKDFPKGRKYRLVRVDRSFAEKIEAHIDEHRLADDDLLFWYEPLAQSTKEPMRGADPGTFGFTGPNANGRTYPHGTLTAYTNGKCRCQYCRAAMSEYRARRRNAGKDRPRSPRTVNTDGHIPNRWFTDHYIKPALTIAGLPPDTRMHRLRHAHASWLLNGGADLMVVKQRLGHASITTTERYLHTLDNADTTALAALAKVRSGKSEALSTSTIRPSIGTDQANLQAVVDQMAEMRCLMVRLMSGESTSGGGD
jgi:integrase